jgi:hypothetical protein
MNHVSTAALGCPASAARRARKLLLSVGGGPTFTFFVKVGTQAAASRFSSCPHPTDAVVVLAMVGYKASLLGVCKGTQ